MTLKELRAAVSAIPTDLDECKVFISKEETGKETLRCVATDKEWEKFVDKFPTVQ